MGLESLICPIPALEWRPPFFLTQGGIFPPCHRLGRAYPGSLAIKVRAALPLSTAAHGDVAGTREKEIDEFWLLTHPTMAMSVDGSRHLLPSLLGAERTPGLHNLLGTSPGEWQRSNCDTSPLPLAPQFSLGPLLPLAAPPGSVPCWGRGSVSCKSWKRLSPSGCALGSPEDPAGTCCCQS